MAFKLNIGKAINKAVGNISKGFKQENNPFKKLHENLQSIEKPNFKNIGEQLNVNKPNIKEGMDMKYGTGDFATGGSKAAQRMKPGESQHQYNVRMQRQKKAPTKTSSTYQAPDPKSQTNIGASTPSYDYQMTERNPGDLREQASYHDTTLPSAPGDMFKYDFDDEGNIAYIDTSKGEDAKWQFPDRGSADDKAIRERYTGSETGDLSSWYGHDTHGWTSSYDWDPTLDEGMGDYVEGTYSSKHSKKQSYLPYDLAQRHYNPNYKGSKK